MKYVLQFGIICAFWYAGQLLAPYMPLPLPGSIVGMLLLLICLLLGVIKVHWVEECSNFFFKYMAFFFVPSGVALMTSLGIIQANIVPFIVIVVVATIIVQAVTGLVLQRILGGQDE